jgi:hypothetical protein
VSVFSRNRGQGYGNIYTPHAGSMIIQVQREHGLANRTLVLTPRQMKLLRWMTSRRMMVVGALVAVSWLWLVADQAQAVIERRTAPSAALERARLDSLERSLGELQRRYEQVSRMLGAQPTVPTPPLLTE